MPWFRLRSGVLWHARSAPVGAEPASTPAPGVPLSNTGNVSVDDVDDGATVGTGVVVEAVAEVDEPLDVVPRVPGGSRFEDLDGAEPVPDLGGLTVAGLRDYARQIGIEVPRGRVAKAVLIELIHDAEVTPQ